MEMAGRIPQLDGIRGIAITLVLLWHFTFDFPTDPGSVGAYLQRLSLFSWSGVDLFFVLSGYLIGGILIDTREKPDYFRRFYIRRAFRILPLYFLVLALGQLPLLANLFPNEQPPLQWPLSFTQNIWMAITNTWGYWLAHGWSLAVEEQFYLVLPLVVWLVPPRRLWIVLAALVAAAPIWRIAMIFLFDNWQTANYVLLPARMDALLLGGICAIAMRDARAKSWLTANTRWLYIALAALALYPAVATVAHWDHISAPTSAIGFTLIAAFYACLLLLAVTTETSVVARVTTLAPLRRFGILAYALYLFHPVIFAASNTMLGPGWTSLVVSSVVLIAMAELSWRWIERPLIGIGHQWRPRRMAWSSW
jgi:peptidoglycan/LPS O-acetylase OafA/YrhL